MKPSCPQMPAAFASLLLVLACTFPPAAAGAQIYESTTTSILEVDNGNQISQGQVVQLEAVVVAGGMLLSEGTVAFYDNGTLLSGCGAAPLSYGIALCNTPAFSTLGVNPITATYSGYMASMEEFFTSTSYIWDLDVIRTPTVVVTPALSTVTTAHTEQVTVLIATGPGNPLATGSVTLSSGSYTSPPATLSSGSTSITIPAGSLAVGSDTLTAAYSPDVASFEDYNSTTGTAPVTVVQAIGSCGTANPNPNPNPAVFAAVEDFNGDCKSDVLWRNQSTNEALEWLMNGTSYLPSSGSPGAPDSDWEIEGVGDFNGDGYADILWRSHGTGEVYLWLMNGTTFTSSGSLGYVSNDWSIAGIGDFNGDGKADILWWNASTGQVYVWFMNGLTMSGGGSISYVSSGWEIAGTGDFNGDGMADILWRNTSTGQLYIWLMNGPTLTTSGSLGSVTSDWNIAGVGDFDGDGKSDILWQNSTTGQVFLWFMNGTTLASSGSVSYVSGWNIDGVGDYDGSGRAGILWRNTSTDQVYIWLMNGATISSTGSPGTPDSTWAIYPLPLEN